MINNRREWSSVLLMLRDDKVWPRLGVIATNNNKREIARLVVEVAWKAIDGRSQKKKKKPPKKLARTNLEQTCRYYWTMRLQMGTRGFVSAGSAKGEGPNVIRL